MGQVEFTGRYEERQAWNQSTVSSFKRLPAYGAGGLYTQVRGEAGLKSINMSANFKRLTGKLGRWSSHAMMRRGRPAISNSQLLKRLPVYGEGGVHMQVLNESKVSCLSGLRHMGRWSSQAGKRQALCQPKISWWRLPANGQVQYIAGRRGDHKINLSSGGWAALGIWDVSLLTSGLFTWAASGIWGWKASRKQDGKSLYGVRGEISLKKSTKYKIRLLCLATLTANVYYAALLGSITASANTVDLRGGRWSSVEQNTEKEDQMALTTEKFPTVPRRLFFTALQWIAIAQGPKIHQKKEL